MEMQRFQRQTTALAMTTTMQAALRILQMNNLDLTDYLAQQALENPCLDLRPPKVTRLTGAQGADWDEIATLAAAPRSLYAHVAAQIETAFPGAEDRRIALAFAEGLEPSGWLGVPLAFVAQSCGVDEAEALAVLEHLQQFEPAGLFARDLAECLSLQAADQGLLTWEMQTLLANLPLLAAGKLADLASLCDATPDDIRAALAVIRSFDPKPGARFAAAPAPIHPPDLRVFWQDGGWVVELNRSTLPRLRLTGDDLPAPDAATRAYLVQARSEARFLLRAMERRQSTLLRTAMLLVQHQVAFLSHGARHIKPLSMDEVAAELALHPSTISRATASRLIETPRGTLPLQAFFSRAVGPDTGDEAQSQDALIALVAEIVAGEDKSRPLSDAAIQALAKAAGATLARRTVTKYREQLGILSSYDRKRSAGLAP
ncbi:RNA polymerase factor sigma-54 [Rhodobacter ferrooxidans]|uniref:RNA polymerase sigma-54 factor n=1 Tax=Rhodobacter ferrooxidans TaxID=371731 RepID=C8S0R6_9RHOB|nr:RNA polymerase factor sigma-54 [Rhodobacter sp. SW2]EEW25357.1 RNA polymerase, sigma 54 subunit, RpoN [Rhodobacter sp. SW2]